MKQDDLAASFRVLIFRLIDCPLNNLVSRNPGFPIARIDTQTDHYVAQVLRPNCRLDFFGSVGFRVSEVGRTKQDSRTTRDRFD